MCLVEISTPPFRSQIEIIGGQGESAGRVVEAARQGVLRNAPQMLSSAATECNAERMAPQGCAGLDLVDVQEAGGRPQACLGLGRVHVAGAEEVQAAQKRVFEREPGSRRQLPLNTEARLHDVRRADIRSHADHARRGQNHLTPLKGIRKRRIGDHHLASPNPINQQRA